jgi:uncharacterized protein YbgA (DUF1722 family)/uncharacterized protein YbbK (DUF523 family)
MRSEGEHIIPDIPIMDRETLIISSVKIRPIRIGISRCLLGERVRFDGGHKLDRFITSTLGQYFEWIPVCPEVELGLGTPRETLRLVQIKEGIGLVMPKSGRDWTREINEYAKSRVAGFADEDLSGYILKSDSPSCGMERVRVYAPIGIHARNGVGLFARELIRQFPDLPIEEEGRLSDPRLRENWIQRVFAYHRLRVLWESKWTIGDLVEFHMAHKLALLAHSPKAFRDLGRLVAESKRMRGQELRRQYQTGFMAALKILATRGRNTNVLQHMAGYFKKQLDNKSRQELQDHIADYRNGYLPLIVPVTLIRHYVRQFGVSYLAEQVYLNPHPKELALQTHAYCRVNSQWGSDSKPLT